MPANTVKVDRTTRWGNYPAARAGVNGLEAVESFANWMANEASEEWKSAAIVALRQKNLACWSKLGTPCHGDYLLAWIENS